MKLTRAHSQQGGVLVLGLFLIMSILFFGLLVVDVARLELAAEDLQRIADASALGGAEFLKREILVEPAPARREENWRAAKKMTLRLLRSTENPIYGAREERNLESNVFITKADCDNDLDSGIDENTACRFFDFGSVTVAIERGYNFRDESSGFYGDPLFTSLEGTFRSGASPDWDTTDRALPPRCIQFGMNGGPTVPLDPTVLANAVRVRVALKALPLTMGGLLRIFTGPEMIREAIASVDLPTTRGDPVDIGAGLCK